MKAKRQSILSLCLVCLAVLGIAAFVLRFAAPNPTHRWYSSDYVDLSLQPRLYGLQAEEILGYDLDLPHNDSEEGERVCFCSTTYTAPAGRCNMCLVETPNISTWSIPDFITADAIIESKAVGTFNIDQQINDFLLVAETLQRELWVFVRLDTNVSDATIARVRATGGDIVPYFVVDGYENRLIAESAINGLLILVFVLAAGAGIWVYIMNNRPSSPSEESIDEVDKAEDSVQDTEEFMKRMERLSKRSKDEDNKKGKS